MDDGLLDQHDEDGVLVMVMRRGHRRNAVDDRMAGLLDAAFARLDAEPRLRAGVLTGEGPCFSAGTDLALSTSPSTSDGGPYGLVDRRRTTPVVAAVEGYALGGGFEMVLACDLVVAARDATFGLPEVKRGVVANCGALFRAPDRLTPALAMQLLLTGEPITAQRAYDVGCVNLLTEPGAALDGALGLARSIAANSPLAVAETMRAVDAARVAEERALWPATHRAAETMAGSADRAEGIAAFFDRRPPQWPT